MIPHLLKAPENNFVRGSRQAQTREFSSSNLFLLDGLEIFFRIEIPYKAMILKVVYSDPQGLLTPI